MEIIEEGNLLILAFLVTVGDAQILFTDIPSRDYAQHEIRETVIHFFLWEVGEKRGYFFFGEGRGRALLFIVGYDW